MVGSFQPIALPMTNAQLYGHNNNNNTAPTPQNTVNARSNTPVIDANRLSQLTPQQISQLTPQQKDELILQMARNQNTSPFGTTPPTLGARQQDFVAASIPYGGPQPTVASGIQMSKESIEMILSIGIAGLTPNPQTGLPASTPQEVQNFINGIMANPDLRKKIILYPQWQSFIVPATAYIQQGNTMAMQNQGLTQQFTQANAQITQANAQNGGGGNSLQALENRVKELELKKKIKALEAEV